MFVGVIRAVIFLVSVMGARPVAAMSPDSLGDFFDERVPREMGKAGVAGAAVVVVKDGEILFARGYGYADVAKRVQVFPDTTLFRVASLSKVVTYTAVMQLVEQGKIDLDADVAHFLDFTIPATFSQPITMRHLMTHTAGFEDTVEGRWVSTGKLTSRRDYLVRQLPKRLFAPGVVPAYSSYGTELAAYVVERVSGRSFEDYAQRHIFAPLGMLHSSFAQPLPAELKPMLTKAYDEGSGPARPFDTAQVVAASAMTSTPLDMGRFMIAHLGGAPRPLLLPATLAQMHAPQFRHHPYGPGVALGLYELGEVAPRALGHTGDIPGFHSAIYLWPAERLGMYIVQNTETGFAMRGALLKQFTERYLATVPQVATPAGLVDDDPDSIQIQGSYRTSRRFESSPLSLKFLLEQSVVREVAPGVITLDNVTGADGRPVAWQRTAPGVWQSTADPLRQLYFRRSAEGDWELSGSRDPTSIMHKVPRYLHKTVVLTVLGLSLGIVLLAVLICRWGALRLPEQRQSFSRVGWLGLLALSPWVTYAGIAAVVASDLLFVASPACALLLRVAQCLAWLAAGATLIAMQAVFRAWSATAASWLIRVYYLMFALACLGGTLMAWQCNLLVWNGRF